MTHKWIFFVVQNNKEKIVGHFTGVLPSRTKFYKTLQRNFDIYDSIGYRKADPSLRYRCDIAAVGESTWSNNAMEYDTVQECENWLNDLSGRWFGYDMSRIVTTDTPKNERILESHVLYQNYRKK